MKNLKIEWRYDWNDCDQEGCSGGEEEGALVTLDGEIIYDYIPHAGCYDNKDERQVYKEIFEALGYNLEMEYA